MSVRPELVEGSQIDRRESSVTVNRVVQERGNDGRVVAEREKSLSWTENLRSSAGAHGARVYLKQTPGRESGWGIGFRKAASRHSGGTGGTGNFFKDEKVASPQLDSRFSLRLIRPLADARA
jgi:hypothetical protein